MSAIQKPVASFLMIANILTASIVSARPQDVGAGRAEFLANCAECHGADGKGTGPLSAKLNTKPADLTTLARNNNGVFAPDAVYQMIDGREAIRAHRSVEMPIWGCRHPSPYVSLRKGRGRKHASPPVVRKRVHEPTTESLLDLPCDPAAVTTDRIRSIVEYLGRIQEK